MLATNNIIHALKKVDVVILTGRKANGKLVPRPEDLSSGKIDARIMLLVKTKILIRAVQATKPKSYDKLGEAILHLLPKASVQLSGTIIAEEAEPTVEPFEEDEL